MASQALSRSISLNRGRGAPPQGGPLCCDRSRGGPLNSVARTPQAGESEHWGLAGSRCGGLGGCSRWHCSALCREGPLWVLFHLNGCGGRDHSTCVPTAGPLFSHHRGAVASLGRRITPLPCLVCRRDGIDHCPQEDREGGWAAGGGAGGAGGTGARWRWNMPAGEAAGGGWMEQLRGGAPSPSNPGNLRTAIFALGGAASTPALLPPRRECFSIPETVQTSRPLPLPCPSSCADKVCPP